MKLLSLLEVIARNNNDTIVIHDCSMGEYRKGSATIYIGNCKYLCDKEVVNVCVNGHFPASVCIEVR